MANQEQITKLNFNRDNKTYRYFLDGTGSVISQLRDKKADQTKNVVVKNAFKPEPGYFYFITSDNNVARTKRAVRQKKEEVVAAVRG